MAISKGDFETAAQIVRSLRVTMQVSTGTMPDAVSVVMAAFILYFRVRCRRGNFREDMFLADCEVRSDEDLLTRAWVSTLARAP